MLSYHWGRWNQNIAPVQTVEESRVLCFGALWLDTGKYIFSAAYEDGRDTMLSKAWSLINEADALVSWNGAKFDTRKMNTEFKLEKIDPPSEPMEVDLMRAVKRRFAFSSNKLDHVAQQLGLGQKVIHEGFTLWPKVMQGDVAARRVFKRYQKQDVYLLKALHDELLPWLPTYPNVALWNEDAVFACVRCGGTNLIRRGWAYTGTGRKKRYSCNDCKKWQTDYRRESTTQLRSL